MKLRHIFTDSFSQYFSLCGNFRQENSQYLIWNFLKDNISELEFPIANFSELKFRIPTDVGRLFIKFVKEIKGVELCVFFGY